MKVAQNIAHKVHLIPEGLPFSSSQFLKYGSRNTIDQTIGRMVKQGIIIRVSRGIYLKPKKSRLAGPILPSSWEIAQFIAKKTGAIIQVHGAEAARYFGLTTQMPTQAIYLTNGPNRKLCIGNLNITLKHVSPRKLIYTGSKVGMAITALWYIGKEEINENIIAKVCAQLTKNEYDEFINAIGQMPVWLANTIQKYIRANQHA